jgi:hypothetical protein
VSTRPALALLATVLTFGGGEGKSGKHLGKPQTVECEGVTAVEKPRSKLADGACA